MAEEIANESPAARGKRLAKEAREAELRAQIEKEMREKIEAEYAAKAAAEKVQSSLVESPTVVETPAFEEPVVSEQGLEEFFRPEPKPWVPHPDIMRDPRTSDPAVEGSVTVHFLVDGLTAMGQQWLRGDEITVAPGSPKWEQLTDASIGRMIFTLTEVEQIRRWGQRFFAPGPWPYTADEGVEGPVRKEKVLRA